MTDDPRLDLEAIAARVAAACPGPWRWCGMDNANGCDVTSAAPGISIYECGIADRRPFVRRGQTRAGLRRADAEFIAHARADVPALVAEVRRLRALLERADARPA